MRNNPFVSIIIANYNGEKYLSTCLMSVVRSSYRHREIIIIDDGSTDQSIKIIEKFCRKNIQINLLRNKKNIGAAASRNKAVSLAKGEIILFLDNDTEVDKNWIIEMVKILSSTNSIGACQAMIRDYGKRKLIQNAGMKLWAATGWGLPFHQWEEDKGQIKKNTEIIAISAALGVKKDIVLRMGGFDEEEAVLTEDIDLSWRIWLAGYRIVLVPTSIIYHWTKSVDMRRDMHFSRQKIYFHLVKNSLTSILKNYDFGNSARYFVESLFISFGRAIIILFRKKELSSLVGSINGLIWVLFHLSNILRKRRDVQKNRKIKDEDLFKKVIIRDSLQSIYQKYFVQTQLI